MNELTKTDTPPTRLSTRIRLLLVPVCLAITWLGFWAYVIPATSSGIEAAALPRSSALNVATTGATATMRIDPVSSTVAVGQIFSVTVVIDNVTNLGGFEFDLSYTAGIVQPGTDPVSDCVRLGPFLGSSGRDVHKLGPNVSDGLIEYGAWSSGAPAGPSGSGTLAIITFKAVATGTTPLGLRNANATDPVGTVLAVNVQDGQVEVRDSFLVYLPIVSRNY
jgi:hypothetical protein